MRRILLGLALAAVPASGLCGGPRPLLVGYAFPQNQAYQPGDVDARTLDRVNYAFANIQDGRMVLGYANDEHNLAFLTGLRKQNPEFKVLVSVGGWLWSTNFSDVSLTPESRAIFIASAVDFLRRYDLDGLDIDWEYPGLPGAGHTFRAEDGHNFTLLLKELRQALDRVGAARHRRLLVSIAAGSGQDFLEHTEMKEAQRYLDTVNLMAYDYLEPADDVPTGHHAPLHTSPANPTAGSAEASIAALERAGVPARKILLGAPLYGHAWGQVADVNHGLGQPGKAIPKFYAPYSAIVSTMLGLGYTRYWDAAAGAPWLYSADQQIFVSYEDPESLKAKCRFVLEKKLGGLMFWSYEADAAGALRGVAWHALKEGR